MTAITTDNVFEAFDEVADRYDLMVGLNPGLPRPPAVGRRGPGRAAAGPATRTREPQRLVDLGCGSGASTRALVDAVHARGVPARIVGVDASAGMLDQARAKSWPAGVSFEVGHGRGAGASPGSPGGSANPVAGVFAAYLFRNVTDRDKVLAARLRPARRRAARWSSRSTRWPAPGRPPRSGRWSAGRVVIPLSWLTSRQTRLYRYLWRSVLDFDSVDAFADRLYAAGFVDVEVRTVSGLAARHPAHLPRARKPAGDRDPHDQLRPAATGWRPGRDVARSGIRRRRARTAAAARRPTGAGGRRRHRRASPRRSAWPSAACR